MYATFRLTPASAADLNEDRYGEDPGGDPGADAGGGYAPPDSPDAAPASDDVPPQTAAPDDEDDDGSDDDHSDLPFKDHPRFKAVLNQRRRLQRQLAKVRPLAERARELGNLDDVVVKARNYEQLERMMEANPRLRAMLSPDPPSARGRQDADEFDPASFPFDLQAPGGQFLLQQAKTVHQLQRTLTQALGELATLKQAREREGVSKVVSTWRDATEAAAAKVPEKVNGLPVRQMFRDAVAGAFAYARQNGIKVQPQKVVDHYLKEMNLPAQTTGAASAAARQRMAENNRSLPRGAVMAGGGPPAAAGRRRESVLDVGKRLRAALAG